MVAPKGHEPYPGCEGGGRPNKYSVEDIERYADELLRWFKEDSSRFWLKDFCLDNGIDPDLMSEWSKKNEVFNHSYKLVKGIQESRVVKGSMLESLNVTMSKFILMNCHGWSDKAEAKVSGDAVNPLAFLLQQADGKSKELVDERKN